MRDLNKAGMRPVFGVIVGLHLTEICVWAGFYLWQKCFPDFETSVYFSTLTYSTLGYGDVLLPRQWRLTGSVESIIVVLLMGWSAAFSFSVLSRFFDLRIRCWQREKKRD
ncbi:MAG: ion channel [Verrucomicrobiota bacterium]|nr:ion channel [Verrucomicrobiota bacterium]